MTQQYSSISKDILKQNRKKYPQFAWAMSIRNPH